jgi:membrane protein YqaA with SNARE-associated domain
MPAFFMFDFEIGYIGLFLTSFFAATIIPVSSEAFLIIMLTLGYDPFSCVLISTAGNTTGGWLNYIIGRIGNPNWLHFFGVSLEKIDTWKHRVHKYSYWLALLSWLPFIGDLLGVALGFFRTPVILSFIFIFIGKFVRYIVLVLIYNQI